MSTRFPIDDLRTLVARALQGGSYSPAESKRIRAVPDTRTIRYYTTLGLIDRPAEMRGRTALYEPQHVMQIVAIKRLQAANQSLSDIQSRLLGITTKQLKKLADLSDDFWESAERYLARTKKTAPAAPPAETAPSSEAREFWDEPPALPDSDDLEFPQASVRPKGDNSTSLRPCLRWEPWPGVTILIDGGTEDLPVDLSRLKDAALPLLNELSRQGLLKAASLPPEVTP
jgi:hypothetical protein